MNNNILKRYIQKYRDLYHGDGEIDTFSPVHQKEGEIKPMKMTGKCHTAATVT